MKKTLINTTALLFISAVLLLLSFVSLGWLSQKTEHELNITGSSISNYFYDGDGTADDPYILNDASHVYYLSWLQNLGKFTAQTHFKLTAPIDMAGTLGGGAIPPIGTAENPFLGVFDGGGYAISNLWVSSNPDDWTQKPDEEIFGGISLTSIKQVGFFGNASQRPITDASGSITGTQVASAKNLVLENLEVTAHLADSALGLIAGYVDCDMTDIGIKNGRISVENVAVKSEASLIGEMGENVVWEDSPLGIQGGNQLLIDPNLEGNIFNDIGASVTAVPGSTLGSAYYSGELTRDTVNGGIKNYIFCETTVTLDSTKSQSFSSQNLNSQNINPTQNNAAKPEKMSQDIWERLQNIGSGYYITPGEPTADDTLTNSDTGLKIPANSIWFQPKNAGLCTISGIATNQSNVLELIIYKITRADNGSITALTPVLNLIGSGGNKTLFVFNVEITDADVGGEFVIGKDAENDSVGFFYLALAGAGSAGDGSGGTKQAAMIKVDYVYKTNAAATPPVYVDMSAESYSTTKVYFTINGTVNGTLSYNMKDAPNADGKVYYTANAALTNKLSSSGVGVAASGTDTLIFPPRATESETAQNE